MKEGMLDFHSALGYLEAQVKIQGILEKSVFLVGLSSTDIGE